MNFSDTEIAVFVQQYWLPFVRIAALLMVMPVIGAQTVSPRVRLVLALMITVLVVPLLPELPRVPALSIYTLLMVGQELVIGIAAGFIFQIAFQVFVLAGQMMAMKMGLGFASMNDPTNGVQTTVLSQFFLMLTTLMFVSAQGHTALLSLLIASFESIPPGVWQLDASMMLGVAELSIWMFSAALVFALPVLTSLLVVNIAFGVMSRAAPQLNIFAIGFPFTLCVGLFLIWVGLSQFLPSFQNVIESGFDHVKVFLRL